MHEHDGHDWTTISPPLSVNGWGQRMQMEVVRLHDKLESHKDIMRAMRTEFWREMQSLRRDMPKTGGTSSGRIADMLMETIRTNWWKIAVALFFLGAAYGKTGKVPDPLAILKAIAGP